jgi:hypothetical protein
MSNKCEHVYACIIKYTDLTSISTKEELLCAIEEFNENTEWFKEKAEVDSGYFKSAYDARIAYTKIKDKLEQDGWWVFDYCPSCGSKLNLEDLLI